jgi:hypothetical protein
VFGTLLDGAFLRRATGIWLVLVITIIWSTLALEPWAAGGVVAPARVVEFIAFAACAVNVHRFILLAEHPAPLRFGRTEWRYIRRGMWRG